MLAGFLAVVDADLRLEQQLLHVAADGDAEIGHVLGLVIGEDALAPVGDLEHSGHREPVHRLADDRLADEPALRKALPQGLARFARLQTGSLFHEHPGELVLGHQAVLEQEDSEAVVGERQGDGLQAAFDQVDLAVLFIVSDLKDACTRVLGEEL